MSSIFHALLYISQPMAANHRQYLVQGGQVHTTSLAIEDPLALASHVVLISCVYQMTELLHPASWSNHMEQNPLLTRTSPFSMRKNNFCSVIPLRFGWCCVFFFHSIT